VRFHSPEYVIREIRNLYHAYQVQALFFFDDNFLSRKSRVLEICELLRQERLPIIWGCQARAEQVSEELLRAIYAVGCRQVTFGLESGSQRVLDSLKTGGVTLEQNRRAVELCHRLGFKTWGTFMIGSPGETYEDIKATRRFMRSLPLSGAMVHVTTAFPGTPLWSQVVERGQTAADPDWKNFTTADASVELGLFSKNTLRKIRRKLMLAEVIFQGKFDWRSIMQLCLRNPKQVLTRFLKILVTDR